jgi:hypothetical protein
MKYNYKCVMAKNGNKMYYKNVNNKWKRISNKIGEKAATGKKMYRMWWPFKKKEKFPRLREVFKEIIKPGTTPSELHGLVKDGRFFDILDRKVKKMLSNPFTVSHALELLEEMKDIEEMGPEKKEFKIITKNPPEECGICITEKEKWTKPFSCEHEMCKDCAIEWYETKGSIFFNCPFCRKDT